MKFFLSNSEDLVDPNYDFVNDKHTPGRDRWRDDVYAHQVFREAICDGIFLSGIASPTLCNRVEVSGGVHAFLRLPPGFPVMGDCGAFSYAEKDTPPYNPRDALTLYQRHGYTIGASVDHLIAPGSSLAERQRRWDITIENAQDFISGYQSGAFTFTPIGVAQGWDPPSYCQAVEQQLKFGYKYIAIGGVTRLHIKYLKPILEEVSSLLPPEVDLHLLGIARLSDLSLFQRLGVTSLNGSTPIKRATMGEYWTVDGDQYEAIRVPLATDVIRKRARWANDDLKLDSLLAGEHISGSDLAALEQTCLSLLRAYDRTEVSVDKVLEAVLQYNHIAGDRTDRRVTYERTLRDRPWRSCSCDICRYLGIEVIIFRGNDRNRRRGFHNTWVFYRQFQAALAADGPAE